MIKNKLKEKIAAGKAVHGLIAPHREASLIEILGGLGWDYYMIDGEHGPANPCEVEHVVRACEVRGTVPLARIRSNDEKLILQFLDAGVMGVMMPGIRTADDIRALVAAVKYPPMGRRGMGPVRAANYLLGPHNQEEYVTLANREILVLPQIENREAVANLAELVSIPGVDGFIVGPRDLAMDMGFIDGPTGHPEVKAEMDHIFQVVRDAGLIVGTVAPTGAKARALIESGVQMILGSVTGLLKQATTQYYSQLEG